MIFGGERTINLFRAGSEGGGEEKGWPALEGKRGGENPDHGVKPKKKKKSEGGGGRIFVTKARCLEKKLHARTGEERTEGYPIQARKRAQTKIHKALVVEIKKCRSKTGGERTREWDGGEGRWRERGNYPEGREKPKEIVGKRSRQGRD